VDEQIVARFMVEQLQFHGIRDAAEAATCLAGYDRTRFPENGGPSFTEFFLPRSFGAGLRLATSGADLWNAFVRAHANAQLAGRPEIQMDYFTRAIEGLLIEGQRFEDTDLKLTQAHWTRAVDWVRLCGCPALGQCSDRIGEGGRRAPDPDRSRGLVWV